MLARPDQCRSRREPQSLFWAMKCVMMSVSVKNLPGWTSSSSSSKSFQNSVQESKELSTQQKNLPSVGGDWAHKIDFVVSNRFEEDFNTCTKIFCKSV